MATLGELRAAIDAARGALLPKRRFAFASKKVSRVKGVDVVAAAAATAAATAAASTSTSAPAEPGGGADALQERGAGGGAGPSAAGGDAGSGQPSTSGPDAAARSPCGPSARDVAAVRAGHGLMGLRNQAGWVELAGGRRSCPGGVPLPRPLPVSRGPGSGQGFRLTKTPKDPP
jgi:hypothetical protein